MMYDEFHYKIININRLLPFFMRRSPIYANLYLGYIFEHATPVSSTGQALSGLDVIHFLLPSLLDWAITLLPFRQFLFLIWRIWTKLSTKLNISGLESM